MINWKLLFKISTLLIALSATVYSMYLLNTNHSNDFMVSLGLGKEHQSLNWCNNRLLKLESSQPGKAWIMYEEGIQWLVSVDSGEAKKLEYLDIEKWLAKYCALDIELYRSESLLDLHLSPFAMATFNDGTTAKIFILGEGDVFQINEVIFKSPEFKTAIDELKNLLKI